MVDILPDSTPQWQRVEGAAKRVLDSYGYQEVRLPIIESTSLFARSIGEVTDIVEKEMYTFNDRSDDSLSLRPEGTAGCVRAAVQHNLISTRQRQFNQLGVEVFGVGTPDLDAELLLMCRALWRDLGIEDALTLEINSIGNSEARSAYRDALVEYLSARKEQLDEDSQRRLESNPLRILDSKNAETQALLDGAPQMLDYLDEESLADFEILRDMLEAAGVKYVINQRLVRGLDYYNKTVFEWTTNALGAQGTVCGGGRYDGLVAQFGGRDTSGAGFAIGLERLVLLLDAMGQQASDTLDIFVITVDRAAQIHALPRIEALRSALPNLAIQVNLGGGSFKSQFKRADKSGARYALVYGESEVSSNSVTLKPLRGEGEQATFPDEELASWLKQSTADE